MIKSISFENYKAFKNGKIEIKPITVLLGANSVGKSALLQLLLMLQQTNKAGIQSYKSALKLYGGAINLGDTKNIFRNYSINEPLKIGFQFKSNDILDEFKENLISNLKGPFYELGRYFLSILDKKSSLGKFYPETKNKSILDTFSIPKRKTKYSFEEFLDALTKEVDKVSNSKLEKSNYVRSIFRHSFRDYSITLKNLTSSKKDEILSTLGFLTAISEKVKKEDFQIEFTIIHDTDRLLIKTIKIENESCEIIKLDNSSDKNKGSFIVSSSIFDFSKYPNNYFSDFLNSFNPSNTIFQSMKVIKRTKENDSSFFSQTLLKIFEMFQYEISKSFDEEQINYVSPLRAHPKRYYMLDKAKLNISLDTLDGDALAEVLKENTPLKNKVNKWLTDFGLNVNVEAFKEVIHKLKIKQNELSLDITDVGFGISQVLPVIIQGFLSNDNSLTIIEQPEIHLHPKMQADLADLFIDIINEGDGKRLLIETHSEYFLKRLRRRIAENKINYRDVVIYLVESDEKNGGSKIEDLDLQSGGTFKYPKDYYGGELLKDATEFIKLNTKI